MTDAELELAEKLFRNPPSAAFGAELGLRLVAIVRELKAKAVEVPAVPVVAPAAPTPPESPKAKAKKEK